MNIKNRLEKLETKISTDGFCGCNGGIIFKLGKQDRNETGKSAEPLFSENNKTAPKVCRKCGYSVLKQPRIIQFVRARV